jgi:hypothetical protein
MNLNSYAAAVGIFVICLLSASGFGEDKPSEKKKPEARFEQPKPEEGKTPETNGPEYTVSIHVDQALLDRSDQLLFAIIPARSASFIYIQDGPIVRDLSDRCRVCSVRWGEDQARHDDEADRFQRGGGKDRGVGQRTTDRLERLEPRIHCGRGKLCPARA